MNIEILSRYTNADRDMVIAHHLEDLISLKQDDKFVVAIDEPSRAFRIRKHLIHTNVALLTSVDSAIAFYTNANKFNDDATCKIIFIDRTIDLPVDINDRNGDSPRHLVITYDIDDEAVKYLYTLTMRKSTKSQSSIYKIEN